MQSRIALLNQEFGFDLYLSPGPRRELSSVGCEVKQHLLDAVNVTNHVTLGGWIVLSYNLNIVAFELGD